jgi:aspartate/methionine/tyrosine aminotransferase
MLSRRTTWDRTENRLTQAVEARRRAGRAVLDLTESNPTRVGLPPPEGLLSPLADPAALVYRPDPRGLRSAREAVATDYRRLGADVDPERLVLTASTSEAYSLLFKLLCDPGDQVLVPRPSYPLFEYLARLDSTELVGYPCHYDGEWQLPAAELLSRVGPRTRAVIVVSPNNPTGAYLKRDEAEALERLCRERGLALIADEVFADYGFETDPRRIPCATGIGAPLTFCLGGLSKSCGLPQLKLGWILVGGAPPAVAEALARLEIVADTYLSVGTPVQVAAPRLLARREEMQGKIRARVLENRRGLESMIRPGSPVTLLAAEGGWQAVLRVPATVPEEERTVRLLEEQGVLVHPGYFFDFATEAHLVLSLLPPPEDFALGASRVIDDCSR